MNHYVDVCVAGNPICFARTLDVNITTWTRRSMEVSCSAAGNAGGETTTFEADQQLSVLTTHSSVCVGSLHETSPDETNSPRCQVPSGIAVNKVADYLDHQLPEKTSAGLADSAVDVTATCPDEPRTKPASDCFTSDLLELLMHDTIDEHIDSVESSVYPDRTAIDDRDQDLIQKSDHTDNPFDSTSFETGNRCCDLSFKSDQLVHDSGDDQSKCKTSDDNITTKSSLDEQRCDSPSSGISSCSVVTADYPDEVTSGDSVNKRDIIAVNSAKYLGAHDVEVSCDPSTVGCNAINDPAEFTGRHLSQHCVCGDFFDMPMSASHEVECVHIECTNREARITDDTTPIIGLDQCKEPSTRACSVAESAHGATDVAADSVPCNAAHKHADTSVKIKNVRPGIPAAISLCALKQQHVDSSDNTEQSRHVTRVNYDARTEGVTVSNADETRASLAMSSDIVPCGGSRHSTNDGKQYINVPTSSSTKDRPHRGGRVRSATVKQCGRPGSRIQVQVQLGDKKMDQLQRHDVHRLLDRGDSRWRCGAHRGPHVLLLTLLCAPLALAISFVISLYMGTICCYNVLYYMAAEGSTTQKAVRCPIIVLTYPFVVFGTALGIGMYAGAVQVSWHLVRWRREFADYEKGFYGWLYTKMDMVQCAPYGVIVLDADFAIETLEPSQDDTEL